MALDDSVVFVNGKPVAVVVARMNGRPLTGRMADPADPAHEARLQRAADVNERIPAEVLADYEAQLEYWRSVLSFDSPMLAPKALDVVRDADGTTHWELLFRTSTYSGFKAAGTLFSNLGPAQRVDLMTRSPLGTPPIVSHAIGANFNLVTADGYLLTTVRSHNAGTEAGKIATAMSEAVKVDDLTQNAEGVWNPLVSARRGFKEELGIEDHELTDLRINALVAQVADGGLSVSGSAATTLTRDEVIARHPLAIDADEAQRLIFTPITAEAIRELLLDPAEDVRAALKDPTDVWAAWGPTGVLETVEPYLGRAVTRQLGQELSGTANGIGL